MALVDELYDSREAEFIKSIYQGDVESHPILMRVLGSKIIESEKILVSNALDIIMLVCMNASFAHSTEECNKVAMIIHRNIHNDRPLPYLLDDQGMKFAEKTLIALTFFRPAMEHRHMTQGAPLPSFYRDTSRSIMNKYEHEDVADNHERWEAFLSEMFLVTT
jgi:hypothetical protein